VLDVLDVLNPLRHARTAAVERAPTAQNSGLA
jgi:hypothetical protein